MYDALEQAVVKGTRKRRKRNVKGASPFSRTQGEPGGSAHTHHHIRNADAAAPPQHDLQRASRRHHGLQADLVGRRMRRQALLKQVDEDVLDRHVLAQPLPHQVNGLLK
jgi:hypothetical protein